MHVKKGNNVIIITGKDKGKQGKIIRVFPVLNRVIVEGVNLQKRHQKPRRSGQKGQIIDTAMPVHASNVMLVDPKIGKGTRTGMKMVGDKKVRVTKKSGSEM